MTARDVTLHSILVFWIARAAMPFDPDAYFKCLPDFLVLFFSRFRLFSFKNVCFSGILLFHLPRMKTKAGAQFTWLKVKLPWTVSLNNNDKIVYFRRTNTYVSKFNGKRKKKAIRLNRNLFQVFLSTQGRWKCFLKCSSSLSTVLNTVLRLVC